MTNRIARQFRPERIILFGSYARGTPTSDSDVDLMVVVSEGASRSEQEVGMRLAVRGLGLPKDILVVTADEVERFRDVPGTLIEPALREGLVVYERGG